MLRAAPEVREVLRQRRAEFWAAVAPVAAGVFIGLVVFSVVAGLTLRAYVELRY